MVKKSVDYSFGRPGSTTWREGSLRSFPAERTLQRKKYVSYVIIMIHNNTILHVLLDLLCREEAF